MDSMSGDELAFMDNLPVELAMEVSTGHLPMDEDDPKAWRGLAMTCSRWSMTI